MNVTNDTCLKCESEYQLTNDFKNCLPLITYCTSYANSNKQSINLECLSCASNSYLDS